MKTAIRSMALMVFGISIILLIPSEISAQKNLTEKNLNTQLTELGVSVDSLKLINLELQSRLVELDLRFANSLDSNYVNARISLQRKELQGVLDKNSSVFKSFREKQAHSWKRVWSEYENLQSKITLLNSQLEETGQQLQSTRESLDLEVLELSGSISETKDFAQSGIKVVNERIKIRSIYWIVGACLLVLLILGIYLLLRHKVSLQKKDISHEIENTRKKLQDQTLKVDYELVKLLEAQISTERESNNEEGENHNLPLKLAEEIHKMRKRLNTMDVNHSVKVLNQRIESLEDTLIHMGYEIQILEGTKYLDGMHMIARFITDESIEGDDRIITRVIRPQVNYKGKLIQPAEVDVSQGL